MKKKKKVIIIIVVITLIIMLAGGLVLYKMSNTKENKVKTVEKVDSIQGYDYHLEDRDTKLYKEEFKKLKENLESNDIDEEEYAKSIAKLFIIDLYTINNKINKYDVGGEEFIHSLALENYQLNVKDTLYKYVDDNSYDDRTQELPEVSKISVTNVNEDTYEINEEEIDAYYIQLEWEYVEDLDYDDEALIIVTKEENKMVVVEKSEIEEKEDN